VRARSDLPFILVSGTIGEEAAVEMMRAGAGDFVLKDRLGRLVPAIERELRDAATRAELRHADEVMRRTEKLRSLGQLSLGIAHDLKNVLNPMSLYLAQIERALERAGARTEPVGKLRDALHHGVQTIDRLRSFGRLEPEAIPVRFELADAAREALALAAPKRDAHTGVELGDLIGDPGTVTGSRRERRRNRDDAGDRGARVRAVLHDAGRERHRPGPRERVRDDAPPRRARRSRDRARLWLEVHATLPALTVDARPPRGVVLTFGRQCAALRDSTTDGAATHLLPWGPIGPTIASAVLR
jgi:signal transduction histidine kinase